MATISKGYSFGQTELVTNTKLHSLVDDGAVTAIVNADIGASAAIVGSKLNLAAAGAIGGTTPAAGAFTTLTATGDIYTNAWTDYSATSTVVGWSDFTAKIIYTKKIGKVVFVKFILSGTSNATGISFTLPYACEAVAGNVSVPMGYGIDNTEALTTPGRLSIVANTATVNCYKDMAGAAWTNSGNKYVGGSFWYESA